MFSMNCPNCVNYVNYDEIETNFLEMMDFNAKYWNFGIIHLIRRFFFQTYSMI